MRKFVAACVTAIVLILGLAGFADAKLVVAGPQEMLKDADLIVIATVLNRNYGGKFRQVELQVDAVLKGNLEEKNLKLVQQKDPMYGWLGFDFPETGTQVMVLLRKNKAANNFSLLYDLNNVAVIEPKGEVRLYKGAIVNNVLPKTYEAEFTRYYRENFNSADTPEQKEVPPKQAQQEPISLKLVFGITVVALLAVVYILKRRGRV